MSDYQDEWLKLWSLFCTTKKLMDHVTDMVIPLLYCPHHVAFLLLHGWTWVTSVLVQSCGKKEREAKEVMFSKA